MSDQNPKRSALQAVQRFLAFLLILALAGAVLWLLSERHARLFAVEEREGELSILRGRELPAGFVPYRPADRVLALAYANLTLNGDSPGDLLGGTFPDRDALDQALFRTLKRWIELRLDSDDAARLTEALKLLRRAEMLGGVSAEQRDQLHELQAKVAFVEGRARLEDAEAALREAVARLKVASETRGRYAREAGELVERIGGLSDQLSRNVRAAASRPARDGRRDAPPEPVATIPVAPNGGQGPRGADAATP